MKKSILLTSLAATLACGGSQLSGADEKAASSSLQASLQANSPSTPTLTAAECNFFGQSGTFNICHVNGSGKFVPTAVTTSGCVNGHIGHAGDYIATAAGCPGNLATALAAGACFPAGAPADGPIPCCPGTTNVNGRCVAVCDANWAVPTEKDGDGYPLVDSDLVVPADATCRIMWTHIAGNVTVYGNFETVSNIFDKDVTVDGGSLKAFNGGNTFRANLTIQNSAGIPNFGRNGFWTEQYANNYVTGTFTYQNNSAPLYIENHQGLDFIVHKMSYTNSPCGPMPTVEDPANPAPSCF
jgi:hypothetical protein